MDSIHPEDKLFYSELQSDDTQLMPVEKPTKFVESFVKRHVKNNKEQVESLLKHKEVIMDMSKRKRKRKYPKSVKRLQQKKVFSCTDKRQLKLFEIPEDLHRYELYVPLHELWLGYVRDSINLENKKTFNSSDQSLEASILKLDLHGCIMKVTKSKCPSYVGMTGILLQETRNVFKLITKENKLKTVPKANSEFTFCVDGWVFTIFGNHFCIKSSERCVKGRFKARSTIDL